MPSTRADDPPAEKSSKKSLAKNPSRVCRFNYRNPYLNFLWEYRTLLENRNVPLKQVFKQAGRKWRQLSTNEKKPYVEAAQAAVKKFGVKRSRGKYGNKGVREKVKVVRTRLKSRRNKKGQYMNKYSRPKDKKLKRIPSCSNCGHRHGSKERYGWGSSGTKGSWTASSKESNNSRDRDRGASGEKKSESRSKTEPFDSDVSSASTF